MTYTMNLNYGPMGRLPPPNTLFCQCYKFSKCQGQLNVIIHISKIEVLQCRLTKVKPDNLKCHKP